jgi:hypothetical protein
VQRLAISGQTDQLAEMLPATHMLGRDVLPMFP